MSEPIIIDGVDVSGCEFYKIEANTLYPKAQYCGSMQNTFCENKPNCYYKQLQRLKSEHKDLTGDIELLTEELEKLRAEYEQEIADFDKKEIELRVQAGKINHFYKEKLREIKEIAEKEYEKKLEDKDCIECDTSFWLIIEKTKEIFNVQ